MTGDSKPGEFDSAFPMSTFKHDDPGLTKRELIAAMALQGALASSNEVLGDCTGLADRCVKMADALLKELNKS